MAAKRQAEKLKVFISYSRQDMAFVDRLQVALAKCGIEAFVDRDHIEKSEDWWARLTQLITDADTIIFVLSPDSVSSKVCADEVAFGERLNKRFVPIVARYLAGQSIPAALSRLDYVWFIANPKAVASGNFDEALTDLVRALETDIAWIREHTRLGALAERWESRKRPSDLLLRGAELATAETWLTTRPEKAPDPTDAHRALVTLSRQAATRSQRTIVVASLSAVVIAAILVGIAFWQRAQAIAEADRAARSEQAAEATTREAQITQSGMLSEAARDISDRQGGGDTPVGMLLALEGIPDTTSAERRLAQRPLVAEAQFQLDRAYFGNRERAVLPHNSGVTGVAWSPDGRKLATRSWDATVRVVEATTGTVIAKVPHDVGVWAMTWSPNGQWLATGAGDKSARIVEAVTGRVIAQVPHSGGVNAVAWSPDGHWLATGSADNSARIVEVATRRVIFVVPHDGPVSALAWSPDGRWLATGSAMGGGSKGQARILDAATGKVSVSLPLDDAVLALAWSPDGKWLATGERRWLPAGTEGTARIIEAATGNVNARMTHTGEVSAVVWSPNGRQIATGSGDSNRPGEVRILEAATARLIAQVLYDRGVTTLAWSPDGLSLAIGSSDTTVRIIDGATGKEKSVFSHAGKVSEVAWSPDGRWLATGSEDKTARIVEVAAGREIARITHDLGVSAVAWSPDGRWFSTVSIGGKSRIVEAATGREINSLAPDGAASSLAWSADGMLAITARNRGAGETRVVDLRTSTLVGRAVHDDQTTSVALSPNGRQLAIGSDDTTVRIIEVNSNKELARLEHDERVSAVAWSLDGLLLATGLRSGTTIIFEAASGKRLAEVVRDGGVVGLAWSPNGKLLAITRWRSSVDKGDVQIVDAATGRRIAQVLPNGAGSAVSSLAWSPDGRWLAVGSDDKTLRIVDMVTGDPILLVHHLGTVTSVAWGPDSRLLATGSKDNAVRIIDATTGTVVAKMIHDDEVRMVAWRPTGFASGAAMLTASEDRTARIWQVFPSTQALVDAAKARAVRCLTPAQRKQYFLPPAPPTWCAERRLWPYHGDEWQSWLPKQNKWLASGRQGEALPLPKAE